MSTISSLAASSSMYRSYPTSSPGRGGASAANDFSATQDTSSTDSDTSGNGTTVTDSQASADYRALAKDMQSDNVTAVQRDSEKLQTDLAVTRSGGGHHHHGGGRLPAIVPSAGSSVNVTV
jgi:hypothetical protein